MTEVTSRLVSPSGVPVRQAVVTARLVASASWLADATARVVTEVEALTGEDGTWALELTPTGDYEVEDAYYEVIEWAGTRETTHACTVPDVESVLLRDVLVTPPSSSGFVPVDSLDDLQDVSTDGAESGQALVFDGEVWLPAAGGGSGTSDHGQLVGLADDDHPGYQLRSQREVASGYAGLDAGARVLIARLPVGTVIGTVAAGDDLRLTNARTPTVHATSHAAAGSDVLTPTAIGASASGHTHSYEAAGAVTAHEGATNPHSVYAADEHSHVEADISDFGSYTVAADVSSAVDAHEAEADPHSGYATDQELSSGLATKSDAVHDHSLNDLSDTVITTPQNGHILAWSASSWINVAADHGNIAGLADDDHLQYFNTSRADARYVRSTDHTKAAHDLLDIDADTLDGIDSAGFAGAAHNHDSAYAPIGITTVTVSPEGSPPASPATGDVWVVT